MKGLCVPLCLAFLVSSPLSAQEAASEERPAEDARPFSLTGSVTASSLPELLVTVELSRKFPVLRGTGALTRGNNLTATFALDVSPISFEARAEAVLTPIAFLELEAGISGGSGWNIALFGHTLHGIGLNTADTAGRERYDGESLDGALYEAHLGAAFQFDAAALSPGDWHHVVLRSYHEASYTGYTRAGAGDSWYHLADFGENRNGFNYYASNVLGYQMPLFLDMVALMAEEKVYLTGPDGREAWGDDLGRWTFSLITHYRLGKTLNLTLIGQMRSLLHWTNDKDYPDEEYFYQKRKQNGRYLAFYRVAAIVDWKIF